MSSLPPAGRGRQPGDVATRRIPASEMLRHLPFTGEDEADEPDDADATPLAPRESEGGYPTMPPPGGEVMVSMAASLAAMDPPAFAVSIELPRGRMPSYPGYTVAAVVLPPDAADEEDFAGLRFLTQQKCLALEDAETIAMAHIHDRSELARLRPDATHIVVSDHNGREVRRYELD